MNPPGAEGVTGAEREPGKFAFEAEGDREADSNAAKRLLHSAVVCPNNRSLASAARRIYQSCWFCENTTQRNDAIENASHSRS